jgi:hypothetical protein
MSPLFRFVVKWARTVHLYLSLFGLGLLLFFGVTGFTLNHEDWFLPPPAEREGTAECEVPVELLAEAGQNELAIVEHLRARHGRYVVGSLTTVEDARPDADTPPAGGRKPLLDISPEVVHAVFKRPGSQVTVDVYRQPTAVWVTRDEQKAFEPGQGVIRYSKSGAVVFVNDLHRGKDSSGAWHLVLDVVAVLIVAVAATGIIMWWSLKGRGRYGAWVVLAGVVVSVAVVWVFELVLIR